MTGFWHGADWNFVIWGLYYFALLVIEKLFLSKVLESLPNVISHIYALFFILVGWLIFYFKQDFGGFEALSSYFLHMFGANGIPFCNLELGYTLVRNFFLICVLCFACTPYPKEFLLKLRGRKMSKGAQTFFSLACDIALVLIFILCIVYISSSDYRPNIYFEF